MLTPARKIAVLLGLTALSWCAVAVVLWVPSCAFAAQLAPDALATATTEELAGKAFDAFALGDWWTLGAVVVFALTQLIKSGTASAWFTERWPKTSAFVNDPRVLFFLPVVLAGVPGVLTAVGSGQPFTLGLLMKSITATAGGAKVIFMGWKNFSEASKGKAPEVPPAAAVLLVVLGLLCSSCSSVKGYLVTGETLDQAGAQFEIAAPIFFQACSEQRLPVDTCRKWRDFAKRFELLYRPSTNAWHAAALVNEAAVRQRYSDMVGPLLAELAELSAALSGAGLLPGAP